MLLDLHQKLMNWNPVEFPQHVHDVVLEDFTRIMSEHLLKVEHDTLYKGVPRFGWSLIMSDSVDVFSQTFSHLGLEDLFPRLPGLIG